MKRSTVRSLSSGSRQAFALRAWIYCVLILCALCAISAPLVHQEREENNARICRRELARIMAAKTKYALAHQLADGATIDMQTLIDASGPLKDKPICPDGGVYSVNPVGQDPTCSHGGSHSIDPKLEIRSQHGADAASSASN